ncbi:Apoptosis-inducing factor 2 [Quaeritorhiza haematococci]|nr:Apoptosis-inducing factor 2 [Quaeritorhiza haematococci]
MTSTASQPTAPNTADPTTSPTHPLPHQIRLLTYNFFLRPPLIGFDHKSSRLHHFITTQLPHYDVIAFQEVFAAGSNRQDVLIEAAKKEGYEYCVCAERQPVWRGCVDAGLVVLSRYPVVAREEVTFGRGVHSDWLAAKGILYAKLHLPQINQHIQLFTTHLQASYDGDSTPLDSPSARVRVDQLRIFHGFIRECLMKHGGDGSLIDPVFAMGDFNVDSRGGKDDGVSHGEEYLRMMDILQGEEKDFKFIDIPYRDLGVHPITTGTIHQGSQPSDSKSIDYIFLVAEGDKATDELTAPNTARDKQDGNGDEPRQDPNVDVLPKSSEAVGAAWKVMDTRVEEFKVDSQPFTNLSDHFGLSTTAARSQLSLNTAMSVPRVLIVGGSFAGVTAALALHKLGDKVEITVVDKRDQMFVNIGALRALVDETYIEKVWVPYTNMFKGAGSDKRKIVQGIVTEVHSKHVKLTDDSTIEFDYLVFATGSTYSSPIKSSAAKAEEGKKEQKEILEAIKKASSVLIVGGGSVGIELAGEVKVDFPDKKVTLVNSGADLLSNTALSAKTKAKTKAELERLGVDVILSDKVIRPESDTGAYHLETRTLTTESGKEIASDVQIFALGNGKYNSDPILALLSEVEGLQQSDLVDDRGRIKTKTTTQIAAGGDSTSRIFVVGDVSNLDETVAFLAGKEAEIAAKNITTLITAKAGTTPKLAEYKPMGGGIMLISIGRTGGVAQLPFGTFGNWVSKNIKSKTLFVPKYRTMLNATS